MVSTVLVAVKNAHNVVRGILFNGQKGIIRGNRVAVLFHQRGQHLEYLHERVYLFGKDIFVHPKRMELLQ